LARLKLMNACVFRVGLWLYAIKIWTLKQIELGNEPICYQLTLWIREQQEATTEMTRFK
jgi:hypothetical protein